MMAEKKIPGSVYIIIGAAMVLMSVFINVEKLAVFILAGAIFIVIGFFKIIMKEKKESRHVPHPHKAHAAHKPARPHKAHAAHPHKAHPHKAKEHHSQTVRCSSCGVTLHPLFKFCPNCGQKMK